jgi:NAD+ kinase
VDLALVVNPLKRSTPQVLQRIREAVPRKGNRLFLWSPPIHELRAREDCGNALDGYELVDDVHAGEVVLALGGDGTLLTAVRLLGDDLRPLLGINLGSLGFLTDTPEERAGEAVQRVLAGRYRCDSRMLLEATLAAGSAPPERLCGLNDIVLHGPSARVLEFSVEAAGTSLGSTMADGVIVATPSGSTAHSLSAGGPVVSPRLRALIMTPISAHTLSMRPLVVSADEGVEIRLLRTATPHAEISVDGHACCALSEGDSIVVRAAQEDLQLVRTQDHSFYNTLRNKLAWGHRRYTSSD